MAGVRNTKPVSWVKAALKDFQEFPEGAKGVLLEAHSRLQRKAVRRTSPNLCTVWVLACWKSRSFHGDAFRVVYAVALVNEIWVIHAFQKRSKQGSETPKHEMALVKDRLKRLKEILR